MKKNLILLGCMCLMNTAVHAFKVKASSMAAKPIFLTGQYEDGSSVMFSPWGISIPAKNSNGKSGEMELTTNGKKCIKNLSYDYNGKHVITFDNFKYYPEDQRDRANTCNGCITLKIDENGNASYDICR